MAPSAIETAEVPKNDLKDVANQPLQHVHGAEDKTPLEAISHGPLVMQGMMSVPSFYHLHGMPMRVMSSATLHSKFKQIRISVPLTCLSSIARKYSSQRRHEDLYMFILYESSVYQQMILYLVHSMKLTHSSIWRKYQAPQYFHPMRNIAATYLFTLPLSSGISPERTSLREWAVTYQSVTQSFLNIYGWTH